MKILFRGLTVQPSSQATGFVASDNVVQQNPRKLVVNEYWWHHSILTASDKNTIPVTYSLNNMSQYHMP